MFGIFELIDKCWGINKVEQALKGSNFDGKVKNKLDWLVRNTMKVLLVFCSIAAFWLGFVSMAKRNGICEQKAKTKDTQ